MSSSPGETSRVVRSDARRAGAGAGSPAAGPPQPPAADPSGGKRKDTEQFAAQEWLARETSGKSACGGRVGGRAGPTLCRELKAAACAEDTEEANTGGRGARQAGPAELGPDADGVRPHEHRGAPGVFEGAARGGGGAGAGHRRASEEAEGRGGVVERVGHRVRGKGGGRGRRERDAGRRVDGCAGCC